MTTSGINCSQPKMRRTAPALIGSITPKGVRGPFALNSPALMTWEMTWDGLGSPMKKLKRLLKNLREPSVYIENADGVRTGEAKKACLAISRKSVDCLVKSFTGQRLGEHFDFKCLKNMGGDA